MIFLISIFKFPKILTNEKITSQTQKKAQKFCLHNLAPEEKKENFNNLFKMTEF